MSDSHIALPEASVNVSLLDEFCGESLTTVVTLVDPRGQMHDLHVGDDAAHVAGLFPANRAIVAAPETAAQR